jgi:hypothetical protein
LEACGPGCFVSSRPFPTAHDPDDNPTATATITAQRGIRIRLLFRGPPRLGCGVAPGIGLVCLRYFFQGFSFAALAPAILPKAMHSPTFAPPCGYWTKIEPSSPAL